MAELLEESGGLIQGDAGAVLRRARTVHTQAMMRSAIERGLAPKPGPKLQTQASNLCGLCGADVALTVSGGADRRICQKCAEAD